MAMTENDFILGKPRGSADEAYNNYKNKGAKRLDTLRAYLDEVYRVGPLVGVDPAIVVAQADLETGGFTSYWWEARANPAGLGITGDDGQNNASRYFTGISAARAHIAHLLLYALGDINRPPLEPSDDPRYTAYVNYYGRVPKATTLKGLENTWAKGPLAKDYGDKVAARGNYAFDNLPMSMQADYDAVEPADEGEDNMPLAAPRIIDRWLHVAQLGYNAVERRYINRRGYKPEVIVLHIQEGYNLGSWQWFHVTTASSTVMIARNGDVWRLVPESDAPWTNGDVDRPTALGREVMNKYGVNDPNLVSLTIETEGFSGDNHSEAQINAIVWQIYTWMQKYDIPLKYVIRHADISSVNKRYCPGDALYNEVLRRLQALESGDEVTVPSEEAYGVPDPVAGFDGTEDVVVNGAKFHADMRQVMVNVDKLNVRKYAITSADLLREPLNNEETFDALGWVNGEEVDGENRWWISKYYSRIWVGGTEEKPDTVDEEEEQPEVLPEGTEIREGVVYYPARNPDGEEQEIEVLVDGSVFNTPFEDGIKVGDVQAGDTVTANFWVVGRAMDNEFIWWEINFEDGTAFMPAVLAQARPE